MSTPSLATTAPSDPTFAAQNNHSSSTSSENLKGTFKGRIVQFFKSGAALKVAAGVVCAALAIGLLAVVAFLSIKASILQVTGIVTMFSGAGFLAGLSIYGIGCAFGAGNLIAIPAFVATSALALGFFAAAKNNYQEYGQKV